MPRVLYPRFFLSRLAGEARFTKIKIWSIHGAKHAISTRKLSDLSGVEGSVASKFLAVLRRSLYAARLRRTEKLEGFRRLDRLTRTVETEREPRADFDAASKRECAISSSIGGRTVFGDNAPNRAAARSSQTKSVLTLVFCFGFGGSGMNAGKKSSVVQFSRPRKRGNCFPSAHTFDDP
jgi:hypothetical protein